MADNNKLVLLHILEIMKKTDELHPLNTTQIKMRLEKEYGIYPPPERKTISRDIECLEDAGYSIMRHENHNKGYYMTDQLFEDYEIKLLADMVNAAPFLAEHDSTVLVKKLLSLATSEGESFVKASTLIDVSSKTEENANKYKIDVVTRAIKNKQKIQFHYCEQGKGKNPRLKCNEITGEPKTYTVSPYYLILNQNDYYLIANPDSHDHLTHFKLSMLTDLDVMDISRRNPSEIIEHGESFNLAEYIHQTVNMWTGELVTVHIRCTNGLLDEVRRRFGRDVHIQSDGDEHCRISIKVVNNEGFYQWLAGCGTNLKVLEPEEIRERYKKYLTSILTNY